MAPPEHIRSTTAEKGCLNEPLVSRNTDVIFVKHAFVSRLHRTAIALGATLLVGGCTLGRAPILDPKGLIALAERDLLIPTAVLMQMVLIPVFVMAFLFSWSFRASGRAPYAPDWSHSNTIEVAVEEIPARDQQTPEALGARNSGRSSRRRTSGPIE
jgi:hypothetical protein